MTDLGDAAQDLYVELSDMDCVQSVGIAVGPPADKLYVYITDEQYRVNFIDLETNGWEGHEVVVEVIGEVRPAGGDA